MMLFTYNKIFKKRTCLFTQNVLYIHIYFLKMKPLQIHEFYIINICTCMHTPTHMAKSFHLYRTYIHKAQCPRHTFLTWKAY